MEPSNGLLQKIFAGLALAAILAGGGALVTQAQLETEVDANSKAIEKAADTQIKLREDVAVVKEKVSAIVRVTDANSAKLDRILESLPKKKR